MPGQCPVGLASWCWHIVLEWIKDERNRKSGEDGAGTQETEIPQADAGL